LQSIVLEIVEESFRLGEEKEQVMQRQRGFDTMVVIFEHLCRLSCKDQNLQELSQYSIRSKVLSLEIILKILESPCSIFNHNLKILYLLKTGLCETLLKNAFSSEKNIFALSFSIFALLVAKFREHLKSEIAALMETVFLKILDSSNSSFQHVIYALNVLNKIF